MGQEERPGQTSGGEECDMSVYSMQEFSCCGECEGRHQLPWGKAGRGSCSRKSEKTALA